MGCLEFSLDEVIIISVVVLVVNEDFFDIEVDEFGGEVSLIVNDLFGGFINFDLMIFEGLIFGIYDMVVLDLGIFVFNLMLLEFGILVVIYQLCSIDCLDLCDISILMIMVV